MKTNNNNKNSPFLRLPCPISPRSHFFARKENQTKDIRKEHIVSTTMEHVQTKLIDYYLSFLSPCSSSRPFLTPFDCCIAPISNPILLVSIKRFRYFFQKQYLQPSKSHWYEPMSSRRSFPVAPGRQDMLCAYWPLAHVERKIQK